ncbi:MAG: hypothetical protein JXC32_14535 [Anaerolineae bacterium]|nr:hypothetical protein [Anaerolineae bacterium]
MASENKDTASSYTVFSQLDDAWKRVMLGESSTTIGANGCLLCSVASGLADLGVQIQGLPADPPRLNRWLARNKGYVAPRSQTRERSLFVFDSMQPLGVKMVDYIDARRRSAPLDVIEKALAADDLFVVIHVDFSPGGTAQQHWVRAVAWYEHDIKVMDPWITGSTQESYLMTRYALPSWDDPSRAIYRIAVYQAVDPETTYPTSGVTTRTIVQEQLYTYQP